MISLRARLVRFLAKQYFRRVTPDGDIGELRRSFEDIATRLRPPRRLQIRNATFAGIDCDWLVPRDRAVAPVLLYLHGGAYIMGSSRTHRRLVGLIAQRSRVRALLPNYRLAPEHPFPAALEDACAVYRALLGQGVAAAGIVIGGDSAGGGLAVATLLALRAAGDPLPAAAILLSPWLDLSGSGESMQTRARLDPLFRAGDVAATAAHYCDEDDLRNPLVSPVYAAAGELPPTFIQVGDHEILLSDATRLADNISKSGGDVTLQIWPDMWHVFQFFAGQMPEAGRAISAIADFVRKQVAADVP